MPLLKREITGVGEFLLTVVPSPSCPYYYEKIKFITLL
jgi:hypothetical protein